MPTAKVAITLDAAMLREIDRRVALGEFASRSQAIQTAVAHWLEDEHRRHQLLGELAKLDVHEERALADETLVAEIPWPR